MSLPMRTGSASIFAKAPQRRAPRDQGMAERDADIAQYRGVGEITLPARHRQFLGEVPQQRIGESEIALAIFEIDRIDLVRHGGGTDLAGDGFLAQIPERHIAPDIAAQVDADDIEGGQRVAVFADPVMRLDLGGERDC